MVAHRNAGPWDFRACMALTVSLCYWTVARDETSNPARRGHRLDNGWHRDIAARRRARSRRGDGRPVWRWRWLAIHVSAADRRSRRPRPLIGGSRVGSRRSWCSPPRRSSRPSPCSLASFKPTIPVPRWISTSPTPSDLANKLTAGRQRRHLRLDRHRADGHGRQSGPDERRSGQFRVQHAGDRDSAGQSQADPLLRRPRQARPEGRGVSGVRALRIGGAAHRGQHRRPLSPRSARNRSADGLAKVTSGEADAGLVYLTDAHNAGDKVDAVSFPEAADAVNIYPIAVLKMRPTRRWRRSSSTW